MGASLITIPLTLHYLGNERFGLWMTISAVVAMATFADFGIGNGVVNTVATACGKDDMDGIRRAISSGFAVLTAIGVSILCLFLIVYRFVPWGDLFRVSSAQARAEAGPAMIAFALCFTLNIPLDVVQRVQLGLQQGFRTNVWQLCSSVVSLVGIVSAVRLHLGVPALVLAFAGAPVLGAAMNALYFFGVSHPDLLPQRHSVSGNMISQIARLGVMFFVLQVVAAISFSADNFIVARTLGAASVTLYSIPQRMFSLIAVLVTMIVAPLWPAYGEAVSRGDMAWVRRTLSRTLLGVFALTSVASATLVLLANRILLWWVGPSIHPSSILLLGLAVWAVIQCVTGTLQAFMHGASILRFQVITHCVFGVACLAVKLWFVRRLGIAGVPWATVITYSLLILLPNALYVPGRMRHMTARQNPQIL
jgi:O-antigen/teichoic acid export membrane protein